MPSNPNTSINFRDLELSKRLDARAGRSQRHQQAKICLGRYQELIDSALSELSEVFALEDLRHLWTAVHGCNTYHAEMLPVMRHGVCAELRDDGHADVAETIESLDLLAWFAVVDACDRVGAGGKTVKDIDAELIRVFGLEEYHRYDH